MSRYSCCSRTKGGGKHVIVMYTRKDKLTPLLYSGKIKKKKLREKKIKETIEKLDFIDIFRTLHPKKSEYTFFTSAYGTFSRMDHILGHKSKPQQI